MCVRLHRIENESDRRAFLEFFDGERLREAYKKAIYHEVLNIDFRLKDKTEPVEFSTYYIRHNKNDSLVVYAFAKKRDREILSLDPLTEMKNRYAYNETIGMISSHGRRNDSLIVFSMDVNGLKSTNDTYEIIHAEESELSDERGYADTISGWITRFANAEQVHPDDKEHFMKYASIEYLRQYFTNNMKQYTLSYRRRLNDRFTKVMMEIIPSPDYTEANQKVFLYVKDIGNTDTI